MIDKKTEADIKLVKAFLELWTKFHSIYSDIISKDRITTEDEERFLETKSIVWNRYDELNKTLEFKYMPHGRLTDPVSDILSVEGVRFVAERNLHKLEDDWKDSYIFLNGVLERLKNKKKRLEDFNPIGVFFKRALDRRKE